MTPDIYLDSKRTTAPKLWSRELHDVNVLVQTRCIIRSAIGLPAQQIDEATIMDALPNWNVQAYVKVVVDIEQHFNVRLQPNAYMAYETVGDLVAGVEALMQNRDPLGLPHV